MINKYLSYFNKYTMKIHKHSSKKMLLKIDVSDIDSEEAIKFVESFKIINPLTGEINFFKWPSLKIEQDYFM